ncbi:MAG: lipoate--protein ligase family protein [Lentisphaeria bacterium]|nr:lipoate--protein ligase family protein [Lentisphaeria bacterium]
MTPSPAAETWDLWQDGAHRPERNMALDEALLLTARQRGRPLLRYYGWDRRAVSIGYVQHYDAAPAGYAVVRRPTGGGVVYHDHDFTYTVVLPAGHWLTGVDRVRSYGAINGAVQAGLERCRLEVRLATCEIPHGVDRLRMVCFQNPTRYDVLLAGRKVAGSAQRRTPDGILHQGSVHFGGPLPVAPARLAEALSASFREIMGLNLVPWTPAAGFLALAADLETRKYATDAWNRRR